MPDFGLLPVFYHRFRQPEPDSIGNLILWKVNGNKSSEELAHILKRMMIGEQPMLIVVPETVQKKKYYGILPASIQERNGEGRDF
jgi:hypothetical protein